MLIFGCKQVSFPFDAELVLSWRLLCEPMRLTNECAGAMDQELRACIDLFL